MKIYAKVCFVGETARNSLLVTCSRDSDAFWRFELPSLNSPVFRELNGDFNFFFELFLNLKCCL